MLLRLFRDAAADARRRAVPNRLSVPIDCRRSRGFTLVEMLVAVAITLVIMASVMALFADVNQGISESMGSLDVQERVRQARNLLVYDLSHLTINPAFPPMTIRTGQGGLEIYEGGTSDASSLQDSWKGDDDDLLWCTVHGDNFPTSGLDRLGAAYPAGEATSAEVMWFIHKRPGSQRGVLYRRVLPILPGHPGEVATLSNGRTIDSLSSQEFFGRIDGNSGTPETRFVVSRSSSGKTFSTLSDLELLANRHGRGNGVALTGAVTSTVVGYLYKEGTNPATDPPEYDYLGDIAVLDNVVAFDIRVWDPGAPLYEIDTADSKRIVVQPGDPGYSSASSGGTPVGFGAFVDLGSNYSRYTGGSSGTPGPPVLFSTARGGNTYDTWSRQYDEGSQVTDGLDNNPLIDGVDDPTERGSAAQPPFTSGLTGIQISIRVYEPSSRTIREMTVRQAFSR